MTWRASLLPLVSLARSSDKHVMQGGPHGEETADSRPAVVIYRAPLFNASETFVRAHALELQRYRPLLAGLEDKGNIPAHLEGSAFLPAGFSERLHGRLGSLGWLADRLKPEKPALVHAHFGTDGLAALDLAARLQVPLVTTLHGYDVWRSRRALLLSGKVSWTRYALAQRKLMRLGDLFLAVSDAVRSRAIQAGYPAERIRTHYIGVDLKAFPFSEEHDAATILHVGRLVEKKGTALLLQAFEAVRREHPDASLVIIGDGPSRGSLDRLAGELELGEAVRFLGGQPPEGVSRWMRRAAVLAVPSIRAADGDAEGLPTVIPEAAASGLPVVGSRHSGIPEAIMDGRTGFLVAEGDVPALAARLCELLASPGLRRSMAAAARDLAETRFSRSAQVERLERLYDVVCQHCV